MNTNATFVNKESKLTIPNSAQSTLGRADTCNIRILRHMSVSRNHAQITIQEDGLVKIQDNKSMNGTKVNGVKLHPMEIRVLQEGDEVQFGNVTYTFHYPDATEVTEVPEETPIEIEEEPADLQDNGPLKLVDEVNLGEEDLELPQQKGPSKDGDDRGLDEVEITEI